MPTIRQERTARFAIIPNVTAEDRTLSFRARGLLAYLLAKPDVWQPRMSELESASDREGRDAIRATMAELISAGYVTRTRVQIDGGKWDWDYLVRDVSAGRTIDGFPVDGEPYDGEPSTETRTTETRRSSKNQEQHSLEVPSEPRGLTAKQRRTAEAQAITREWWDAQPQPPLLSFIAVQKIVERAVTANYAADQIGPALARCRVITLAALQSELRTKATPVNQTEYAPL